MDQADIVAIIECLLKTKGLEWKTVDMGSSTVIGIDNIACFEATRGGFSTIVEPSKVKSLEERPEATVLTDSFVPINDKLFIDIKDVQQAQDIAAFWVDIALAYLPEKKLSLQQNQ